MGIFLRLKHWVIFMLTFGLFAFVGISVSFTNEGSWLGETLRNNGPDMDLRVLLMAQTICLIFANFWRYSLGTRLHKKHYYNSFMLLIFRWSLYFSTLFNTARFVVFPAVDYFDGSFNTLANLIWLTGGIYCDYFLARMLVSAEQRRTVSFKDFSSEFFAFIFFPVGVWWLQPRVNAIFSNSDQPELNTPLDYNLGDPS